MFSSYLSDNGCTAPTYAGCTFSEMNHLTFSADTTFTSCNFTSLTSSDNGGAISLANSDSTLTVEQCSFTDCTAQNDCGGAVCIYRIRKASIIESLFLHCIATGGNHYGHGGGGIYLEGVGRNILISYSSFLDSSAQYDGGGVVVCSCSCTDGDEKTIQDSRFINCKGTRSDGGGIMANQNNYNVGIINTLFSGCSNCIGGGFDMSIPSSYSSPFITFCFFNHNTADHGNDVGLESGFNADNPILLSCFSITDSMRVGYVSDRTWHNTDVDWLPQSTLRFKIDMHSTISSLPVSHYPPIPLSLN